MRKLLLTTISLFIGGHLWGQSPDFSGGLAPEITLSRSLAGKLQLVGKVESQQYTFEDDPNGRVDWRHMHKATDFQFFMARSFHPLWKVAGGYQYQLSGNGDDSHRAIQQLSFVQPLEGFRLGHRLRTDQTFYPEAKNQYRLRYRLSGELPLQGVTVDPGEYYLILSNELLYEWQGGADDLENRGVLALGFYFNRVHKLEAGMDYRRDRYLRAGQRRRLWLSVGWYVNL